MPAIVGEIAAASTEQAAGIDQVNQAITQMDEMTQQNAALVEESTAAAHSLEEQSRELNRLMGFFQVGAQTRAAANAPVATATGPQRPPAKAAAKPGNGSHLAKLHAKAAPAKPVNGGDGEGWSEF